MPARSLQEAIDQAGSPVRLLWRQNAAPWTPPVLAPEYVGWRQEQGASNDSVALSDLSHHMSDLFIDGPDAMRLLSEYSANDYEHFEVGQAKQFIAVNESGYLVSDGILMRDAEQRYTLSGAPPAQNWIRHHGERAGYRVSFTADPDSAHRNGSDPVLFRYQVQGPQAQAITARVFGGPFPATKFFHSTPVTFAGHTLRALRHGMTGQPGYEFIGPYERGAPLKEAFLTAGEEFGLVEVGGLAYSTNGIESGWIPTQTPAIYTSPELRSYREDLSLHSYEGQKPLSGSFFSENIEDYYCSPYELGYGRSIDLDHDFVGRDALAWKNHDRRRTKVTLVLDPDDVENIFGEDPGFVVSYGRYRVEHDSSTVGMTCHIGSIAPAGRLLALALVDEGRAAPGTEVTVIWGEHPGPGALPDADADFKEIRATVQVSPYNEYARTQYRRDP